MATNERENKKSDMRGRKWREERGRKRGDSRRRKGQKMEGNACVEEE